jgi:hypothetical protein
MFTGKGPSRPPVVNLRLPYGPIKMP